MAMNMTAEEIEIERLTAVIPVRKKKQGKADLEGNQSRAVVDIPFEGAFGSKTK